MIKILKAGLKNIGVLIGSLKRSFVTVINRGFILNNNFKQIERLEKCYQKAVNKKKENELYRHFINRFNKRV